MENEQKKYRIDPAVAMAIALQAIFIIFASIAIYNILSNNVGAPGIRISNYSAIPDGIIIDDNNMKTTTNGINFTIDDTAKKAIESTIYDEVLLNNRGSIANNGAKIREGSAHYVYIEDLNAYFLNFIVDLEELGQSYRFVWLFGDNSLDRESPRIVRLMAFCPRKDEMIYGEFDCEDDYNENGSDIMVYELLKQKLFSNFTVGVSGNVYDGDPLSIRINTISDEKSVEDAAVQEVYEYLAVLGFDLYDYNFVVGSYVCCSLD